MDGLHRRGLDYTPITRRSNPFLFCEAIVVVLDSEPISALFELGFSSVLSCCVEVVFQGAFVHTLSGETHLKSKL